jgi:hypothetical protein
MFRTLRIDQEGADAPCGARPTAAGHTDCSVKPKFETAFNIAPAPIVGELRRTGNWPAADIERNRGSSFME